MACRRKFGIPWPECNDGLSYDDVVRTSDSAVSSAAFVGDGNLNGLLLLLALVMGLIFVRFAERIKSGQITFDGRVVTDSNAVLRVGSKLVYHRLPWKEPDAPHMIEVLYEDDDMIALNKPSGLQVLPGGLFQQRTVLTQLQWKANLHKKPHPVPVHRLGRGTSGILLCAKTKLARVRLASYFADGTSHIEGKSRDTNPEIGKIAKIYRGLASGIVENDQVTINQPIGVVKYPCVAKGLYVASESGKPALSVVSILERNVQENSTLVQVKIQSGRPHQIRIHLSFMGHPLLGDPLYDVGGKPKCLDCDSIDESFAEDGGYQRPIKAVPGDCGYNLHAHKLVLSHPLTNEIIEITAPLPSTLQTPEEAKEIASMEQTFQDV
ncbi:RNA pseudouridine synthase [Vigna angularis]|uniref:RNA pseudouridine synthase n=1 Tax=Phaseolus angularis TaxID=3914 RepID=A0A8T0KRM9_PHAAN|nr:RNA pseudouridine synthase [Vigna angularis]